MIEKSLIIKIGDIIIYTYIQDCMQNFGAREGGGQNKDFRN